jgi:hypothetical protein
VQPLHRLGASHSDTEEIDMISVHNGQCGVCTHFGEHNQADKQVLTQILTSKQAPESLIEGCGLPKNAALHLKVTAMSGCDGFQPAAQA